MSAITTHQLTKNFRRRPAVHTLDLDVPVACAYGLLGGNGAGKTTTLRMLTTVLRPTSGSASLCGFDVVKSPNEVRRSIGVVQDSEKTPLPHWHPIDYVTFFAQLQGLHPTTARARAEAELKEIGLGKDLEKPIGQFSSGMRKKVELVRALAHRPKVLFLDEPTKQLDIMARLEFWRTLQKIREEGTTVVLASHDPAEIAAVCTHVGVLRSGRLSYQGSLAGFTGTSDPRSEDVQRALEALMRRRSEFSLVSLHR